MAVRGGMRGRGHAWQGGRVCVAGWHAGQGVCVAGGMQARPPVDRMTDACKNITLPQTSFAGGRNERIWTEGCGEECRISIFVK